MFCYYMDLRVYDFAVIMWFTCCSGYGCGCLLGLGGLWVVLLLFCCMMCFKNVCFACVNSVG